MAGFASAVWAAGPYSATFNSVALGIMRGGQQQPFLRVAKRVQPIKDTHLYGQTPIGGITQGGEGFGELTLMEYLTAALTVLWPYDSAQYGAIPPVGYDEYESHAAALVLTAVAGTRAATSGPASATASKAVIAEDFDMRYTLGPELREIPLRFRLYPISSSVLRFWTTA